jgi:acetyl esterase
MGLDERPSDAAEMRKGLKALAMLGMPREPDVHVDTIRIPTGSSSKSTSGSVAARVYRAFGGFDPQPAIVYFHGGGWVTGDLDTHDGSCRRLALDSRCTVISVEYRLAPEDPFPAAPLDCLDAYGWVIDHALELAIVPNRVGVAGDSAGGNLAAVVAQEASRRDMPSPFVQGLIYPATDHGRDYPSYASVGHGFGLDMPAMERFWGYYLPASADPTDPMAMPMRYPELANATPAIVVTAGFDPLRDEGLAYANALRAAGTPVEFRCYDSFIHGFFGMGLFPYTMAAIIEIGRALGEAMHR